MTNETFKNQISVLARNLMLSAAVIACLFFSFVHIAPADVYHGGSAVNEDSDQDWNGDGVLDGVDKNGGTVGDKLLAWTPATGVQQVGEFTLDEGYTLTIEPGTIIKFGAGSRSSIYVHGTLVADGTPAEKIVFTSSLDDSYGGDTNGDGNATIPAPGNWGAIHFLENSSGCVLDNAIIQYAAADYWYQGSHMYVFHAIYIDKSDPLITNNIIRHILFHGIECHNSTATISGNTFSDVGWNGIYSFDPAQPTISGNTINSCGGNAIEFAPTAAHTFTVFPTVTGNTFSGNYCNGVKIASGTLIQNSTWPALNCPYVLDDFGVDTSTTLTLEPGVTVKFRPHSIWGANGIRVHGTLNASGTEDNQIVFTSFLDDAYGGDTNGNQDSTAAANGDWGSIAFYNDGANSVIDHAVIQFGGAEYWGYFYSHYAILCDRTNPTISNSVIQNGLYDGIYCSKSSANITGNVISNFAWSGISCNDSSMENINGNVITENTDGIYSKNSNPLIANNSIFNNSSWGVYNASTNYTLNADNNWWGDASGPNDASEGEPDYNPGGLGDKVTDYVSYRPWSNSSVVGIGTEDKNEVIPAVFLLFQNYPNPFNPVTTIQYNLPRGSEVSIIVYNMAGQKVAALVDGFQAAGKHSVQWEASGVSSGVYFYQIHAGKHQAMKKCLLLK